MNLFSIPRLLKGAVTAALLTSVLAQAQTQEAYPTRPVKLVVTFGAGGLADVVARLVAVNLGKELGQSVVVDNRAGASGVIGAQAVAKSPADGYTLMSGTPSTQVINPLIYAQLPYDPWKEFKPISLFGETPLVVTVSPHLNFATLGALVQYARANPGKLTYASAGVGTAPHMAAELLKLSTGVDILHVPYKSGSEAVNAVVAGQVDMLIEALPVVGPQIAGKSLKALAVPRTERLKALPDVVTTAEAGFANYVVLSPWSGLAAPAGTSPDKLAKLERAVTAALADPALRTNLEGRGVLAMPPGPAAYQARLEEERQVWTRVVQSAGIKAQ